MKNIFWTLAVLGGLIPQITLADTDQEKERPFLFAGPCTAQGNWTREALNATQRLRNFTLQMKDAKECKGLPEVIGKVMSQSEENLNGIKGNFGEDQPDATLPRKGLAIFDTIETVMKDSGFDRRGIMRSAIAHNIESAKKSATDPVQQSLLESGNKIKFRPREELRRSVKLGLSYAEQLIDNLPTIQTCAVGDNSGAQYFSAVTHILAAYASSGQDGFAADFARMVQKLASLGREGKFAAAIRATNNADFLSSLQCIMEVTSESYCSANDAQMLFSKVMNKHVVTDGKGSKLKLEERGAVVDQDIQKLKAEQRDKFLDRARSPLGGYYVLSQHVPNISSWLLKIQIGVDPNLPNEADFQKNVMDRTMNFFKMMKDLQAAYRYKKLFIEGLDGLNQKQNAIVDLVSELSRSMTGGSESFFTQTVGQDLEIPFKLLRMEVPARVRGNDGQGRGQDAGEWVRANYTQLQAFQDPPALLETVGSELNGMIQKAEAAAIVFYNRFFIVDKIGIVNDSFAGMNFNVRESLTAIYYYLDELSLRLKRYGKDLTLVSPIEDTKNRILAVLVRFDRLKKMGEEISKSPKAMGGDLSKKVTELNISLIEEVYKQFEVLLARTGWLQNRMITFVQYDFIMMVRHDEDLEPYYQELYRALGIQAVLRMTDIGGASPGPMMEQLAMAQEINKRNLQGLEAMLSDRLAQEIATLRLRAEKNKVTGLTVIGDNMVRRFQDGFQKNITENVQDPDGKGGFFAKVDKFRDTFVRVNRGSLNFLYETLFPFFGSSSERYLQHDGQSMSQITAEIGAVGKFIVGTDDPVMSPDDEHGSAKKLRAQLCVQALAFDNLRPFWYLCEGTKLQSPYPAPDSTNTELRKKYDEYLSVQFKKKAWEDLDLKLSGSDRNYTSNKTKRICAFRDFNRRNLVMLLTRAADQTYSQDIDLSQIKVEDFKRSGTIQAPSPSQSGHGGAEDDKPELSRTVLPIKSR